MNLKKLGTEVLDTMVKNRPMLTTIAAIGAAGLTGFIIFRKAPEIRDIMAESKDKIADIEADESLSAEEKKAQTNAVKTETLKDLACPIGMIIGGAVLTGALIVSINKAHDLKTEALIAGYEVAKGKVVGYEKILPEIVGEKKAEEIKNQVASTVAKENSEARGNVTVFTDVGSKHICRDVFGNEWIGTYAEIEEAKLKLNEYMSQDECDATLNDFYDYLPNCHPTVFGQDTMFLRKNGWVDIRYSTDMDENTHQPIIIVDYDTAPICMNKRFKMTDAEETAYWRYGA